MKNQSGVTKLTYCHEHDMYRIHCSHIHEGRAIKGPLEVQHFVSFNDGNNLHVIDLKLRLEHGKVLFLNKNNRWQVLEVKLTEKLGMIE